MSVHHYYYFVFFFKDAPVTGLAQAVQRRRPLSLTHATLWLAMGILEVFCSI